MSNNPETVTLSRRRALGLVASGLGTSPWPRVRRQPGRRLRYTLTTERVQAAFDDGLSGPELLRYGSVRLYDELS
jgi:hypothetical protein